MKRATAVAAILAATLAGCTSSPHTPPPDAPISSQVSSSPSAPNVVPGPDRIGLVDGKAVAPTNVPRPADREMLAKVIEAANAIAGLPYRYGGGHRPYPPAKPGQSAPPGHLPDGRLDSGCDGSGAVSYVLHAAGLLPAPLSAEQLRYFGKPGPGRWITALVCGDGAHIVIAGMRFDAHAVGDEQPAGPHWRPRARGQRGCVVRHPQDH